MTFLLPLSPTELAPLMTAYPSPTFIWTVSLSVGVGAVHAPALIICPVCKDTVGFKVVLMGAEKYTFESLRFSLCYDTAKALVSNYPALLTEEGIHRLKLFLAVIDVVRAKMLERGISEAEVAKVSRPRTYALLGQSAIVSANPAFGLIQHDNVALIVSPGRFPWQEYLQVVGTIMKMVDSVDFEEFRLLEDHDHDECFSHSRNASLFDDTR